MNDIEKRARELLAAEMRNGGFDLLAQQVTDQHAVQSHNYRFAISAIVAALTPPEGYVRVPECHTPAMDDAGCLALFGSTGGKQSAQVWKCWDAMVAARPEVMP